MNSDRRPTPDRVKFISERPRRLGIDFVALAATYRPVLFVFIGPGRPPRGVGFSDRAVQGHLAIATLWNPYQSTIIRFTVW